MSRRVAEILIATLLTACTVGPGRAHHIFTPVDPIKVPQV